MKTRSTLFFLLLFAPAAAQGGEPPALSWNGGTIGQAHTFYVDDPDSPGETTYIVPSFQDSGLVLGGTALPVGGDLLDFVQVVSLDGTGQGDVTFPVPNAPSLVGNDLHAVAAQAGITTMVGDMSNDIAFGIGAPDSVFPAAGGLPADLKNFAHVVVEPGVIEYIVGGQLPDGTSSDKVLGYDPDTQSWQVLGQMTHGRYATAAVALPSGRIFIAGGIHTSQPVWTTEVFDPWAGISTPTANMGTSRAGHTATLTPGDNVLVSGGYGIWHPSTSTFVVGIHDGQEIYDPLWDIFTWTTPMLNGRWGHTSFLRGNDVVHAGGVATLGVGSFTADVTDTVEQFDPTSGMGSFLPSMPNPGAFMGSATMCDGDVLFAGGADGDFMAGQLQAISAANVFDVDTDSWTSTAPLPSARCDPSIMTADVGGECLATIAGGCTSPVTAKSGMEGDPTDTGLFWFFGPGGIEETLYNLLGLRDDVAITPVDHYWVFAASISDVGASMIVTDAAP